MDGIHYKPSTQRVSLISNNARNVAEYLETCCPYPDWSNVTSSLLGPPENTDLNDNFMGERWLSASQKNKYWFQSTKSIDGKFPLTKRFKYAYPLFLPETSKKITDNDAQYIGNCLKTMVMGKQTVVVHPGKKCTNISVLKKGSCTGVKGLHYKLVNHVKCESTDPVYQIDAKNVLDNGYILCRYSNSAEFTCLKGTSYDVETLAVNPGHGCELSGVCLNDTLPGYFTMAYEDGTMLMYDINNSEPLWKYDMRECEAHSKMTSYHCGPGNHPMTLVVNNADNVWTCDTRDSKSTRVMLDSEDVEDEEISLSLHCGDLPYYYVLTKNCLFVFDDRFNKLPSMKWNHMLMTFPTLLTKQKLGDTDVVLISSQETNQTCAIVNEWIENGTNTWCKNRNLPKHFNFQDTIDFAQIQGIPFPVQTKERLSSPNAGIDSCIMRGKENEMSLLSLNSFGDVFAQHFTILEACDKEEETGKNVLKQWQESAIEKLKKKNVNRYPRPINTRRLIESIKDPNIGDPGVMEEMISPKSHKNYIDKLQTQKNSRLQGVIKTNKETEDSETGNPSAQEEKSTEKRIWDLRKLVKPRSNDVWIKFIMGEFVRDDYPNMDDNFGKYFPKQIAEKVNMDSSKISKGTLTAKLLAPWNEERPAGEGFHYHTAPLVLNRLCRIPSRMKDMDSQPELEANDDFEEIPIVEKPKEQRPAVKRRILDASQTFQLTQILSQVSTTSNKKRKKKRVDGF